MSLALSKLLTTKKYFILDLDGTLYQGDKLFPYTIEFLQKLRKTGRQPIFLTNNSSKSATEYLIKLKKIGINCSSNEIYTSSQATIEYLSKKGLKRIFLMATPQVENEFTEAGFELITVLESKIPAVLGRPGKHQNGLNKTKIDQKKSIPAELPTSRGSHF